MTDMSLDLLQRIIYFLKKMTASLANKSASGGAVKAAPNKELAEELQKVTIKMLKNENRIYLSWAVCGVFIF